MSAQSRLSQADERTLRRFLLGELEEGEREGLEARVFEDDDCFEHLLTAEEALIDAYLTGRLAEAERDRFERRYLATEAGRQRIATARAAASQSRRALRDAELRPSLRSGWRVHWKAGLAAAAALALLAGGTWAWHYDRQLRQQLADMTARLALQHERERDLLRQLDAARGAEGSPGNRKPRPPASAPAEDSSGPLVALFLHPGLVRDGQEAAHVQLPRNASLLVVHLRVERGARAGRYRALVRTVEGTEVWRQEIAVPGPLSPGQPLAVAIPVRLVEPDEYLVTLQAQADGGRFEDLATYFFRIDDPR